MLNYGDISPAVAAYSIVRMLKRAMPYLQLEKFGQTYPLPTNSTQTAKFRRYFLVGATGTAGSARAPTTTRWRRRRSSRV
jgi:N4-gp56 family major capsid protein